MPSPKRNESEKDYVSRCIPFVLREPKHKGMKPDQAAAMCHSLYREHKKGAIDTSLIEVAVVLADGSLSHVSLYDSVETYMQHLDAQAGRKPTEVQTLIMAKTDFPAKADAQAWAKAKGFKSSDVRETTNSWRLRQKPPEDFIQNSFRIIQMRKGVQSVIGHPK